MTIRRMFCLITAVLCLAVPLGGCSNSDDDPNPRLNSEGVADKVAGYQLDKPAVGDEIAVIRVKIGNSAEKEISIRLFPEAAPLAVDNFKGLAKEGYYDDIIFHRVEKDLVIQGGDPDGTGSGNSKSIYATEEDATGKFNDEFTDKVFNLRGAVAMANTDVDSNTSQFFFNMNPAENVLEPEIAKKSLETARAQYNKYRSEYKEKETTFQSMAMSYYGVPPLEVPDEVLKLYKEHGGYMVWDGAWRNTGGHTVFGQVFEGMDVLEEINEVGVNVKNKPDEDITIVGVDITTYNG